MKRYGVSKNFRLTFTAIVLGCVLFFPALLSLIGLRQPAELDADRLSHLHSGQYVTCQINEYFTLPISINGEEAKTLIGRLDGLSAEETGTGMDYVIFFAKMPNGKYLRTGIHDPKLLHLLDQYEAGHGEPISFKGKVVFRQDEYYYLESLRGWKGFDYDQFIRNYYILEINEDTEFHFITLRLILGTLCLGFFIFLIASGSGIYPIMVRPLEETPEYIRLAKVDHYALPEELEQKKRKLRVLHERQAGLKFWALLGILILIAGTAAIIDYILLGSFQFFVFLAGLIMLIAGAEILWHVFINSGSSTALRLADRFTLETYATRISREEILISVIDRRIEEEKRKKRK